MSEVYGQVSILKTGPGTSIQDLGRKEWAKFGVPISGPADHVSMEWINHVLRNDPNASVLEISQPGLKMEFLKSCEVAIAGASCNIILQGNPISSTQKLKINPGDILEIGAFNQGARVYVGIKGGFQTSVALGSRSFYPKITSNPFVQMGDLIPYCAFPGANETGYSLPKWDTAWFESEVLEFYPGPDYQLLSNENRKALHNLEFSISPLSSRMGSILNESLPNQLPELPTNPVYPGIVQLTSGGKLIILGPDAQVTGGYPRIMFLTPFSQSILAQKKPGQKVRFIKKTL